MLETLTAAVVAAFFVPSVWVGLALQIADIATTIEIVHRRGGVEKNPVVAALMRAVGPAWPLAKFGIAGAGVLAAAPIPWLAWGLNAAMAAVVIHNLRHLRR